MEERQVTLESLKEFLKQELEQLYDAADDEFVLPRRAKPEDPLSYPIVRGLWWSALEMMEDADCLEYEDELFDWFKKEAENFLWDRLSKVDWASREESRRRLLATLQKYI